MSVRAWASYGLLAAGLMSAALVGGCAGGATLGPSRVEAGLAPTSAPRIASERLHVRAAVADADQRRTIVRPGKSPTMNASGGLGAHGLDHVYFASGRSDLLPEARDMLLGQLHWLKANPRATISIEGHADEPGTRDYNIALGSRRAAAVRDFLLQRGVRERRILRVVSFGLEHPAVRCVDMRCRARNRRVQTVLANNPASRPVVNPKQGSDGGMRSASVR